MGATASVLCRHINQINGLVSTHRFFANHVFMEKSTPAEQSLTWAQRETEWLNRIRVQNVVPFYLVDVKIPYKLSYGWISPHLLVAIQEWSTDHQSHMIHPLGTVHICTMSLGFQSSSCLDSSLKARHGNLLLALESKSRDLYCLRDLSSGGQWMAVQKAWPSILTGSQVTGQGTAPLGLLGLLGDTIFFLFK